MVCGRSHIQAHFIHPQNPRYLNEFFWESPGMARCVQGTPLFSTLTSNLATSRQHCVNTVIESMQLCGCWKPQDRIFCFQMFSLSLVFITHSFFWVFSLCIFFRSCEKKLFDRWFSSLCSCFSSSQCGPAREDSGEEKKYISIQFCK